MGTDIACYNGLTVLPLSFVSELIVVKLGLFTTILLNLSIDCSNTSNKFMHCCRHKFQSQIAGLVYFSYGLGNREVGRLTETPN